jgi:hypothetical protein
MSFEGSSDARRENVLGLLYLFTHRQSVISSETPLKEPPN